MKKMFFSAVALVAFSAVSMANTIEVKEVIIENETELNVSEQKVIPTIDVCALVAIATYLEMEEAGFPPSTCASEAQGANYACQTNQ